jgi:hypothetical protein
VGLNESELDSVRTGDEPARVGRSLWQKPKAKDGTKHVKARTFVAVGMVGAGRLRRVDVEAKRTDQSKVVFRAKGPKSRLGSSQSTHSSDEAGNDRGAKGCRKEKP